MTADPTPDVLAVLGPDGPALADPAAPLLRADDLGVLRGESVFETLRVLDGRAARVPEHLERLAASAARVGVALPDGLGDLVALAAGAWQGPEAALRLVVTKGPGTGPGTAFALVSPVPGPVLSGRAGIRVVTLPLGVPAGLRPRAPWLLGGVKATSYAVNMAVLREAAARGADDAVLLSADGEVLEGPTASCAWVSGGVLVTPPSGETGILPGTTVAVALELHDGPVQVRRGSVEELRAAEEVLLLSSVRLLAPVVALDGVPVGDGTPGPVARRLGPALERALRG